MSKITWPVDTLWVFGWVKSSDLRKAGDMGGGFGTGSGRFGVRDPQWTASETLVCENDVPLIAAAFGERKTIGYIQKKTLLSVLSRDAGEASVGIKTKAIHAVEGATFSVREADLQGCRKAEP